MIIWFLWTVRNEAKHQGLQWSLGGSLGGSIILSLFFTLAIYFDLCTDATHPPCLSHILVFQPTPPVGSYKINIDGYIKDDYANNGALFMIKMDIALVLSLHHMETALYQSQSYGLSWMRFYWLDYFSYQTSGWKQTRPWLFLHHQGQKTMENSDYSHSHFLLFDRGIVFLFSTLTATECRLPICCIRRLG